MNLVLIDSSFVLKFRVMKTNIKILILLFLSQVVFAQDAVQTIRGQVMDADSQIPLIGVSIQILNHHPQKVALSDVDGSFRLEGVNLGRVDLQFNYLGYDPLYINSMIVNSAKEVVLEVNMTEALNEIEEVVISASTQKGEAINEMATLSTKSVSAEETNRYAGGFNDPSRLIANFAGVTNTQDGSNDVIIRGNAPKYVQWRLEGVEISNPNHFADQGSVGGSISMLNNNMMGVSDFHTGAFTAEYGDVLSGVYDLKFRNGNNEKFESTFGLGLLGTDLTFEGPFSKNYKGSFLVNYRYSTISLINDLGLSDIEGLLNFQDASFKIQLPTKSIGTFSIFGLGGNSSFLFEDVDPQIWITPGNSFPNGAMREDFKKSSFQYNLGLKHTLSLNDKSYFRTTLSRAIEGIEDEVTDQEISKIYGDEGVFLRDSILNSVLNYDSQIRKTTSRINLNYHNKISKRTKLQIGSSFEKLNIDNKQSIRDYPEGRTSLVDLDEGLSAINNYLSVRHKANEHLTFFGGLHNFNFLETSESTIEPRLAISLRKGKNHFRVGYGLHSMRESIHNYFVEIEDANEATYRPNTTLELLKAHHYVVSYDHSFHKNLNLKLEGYYQDLYNLPVENDPSSIYSSINEGLDFNFVDLVNEGEGKNYGLELTVNKYFSNRHYWIFNASVFDSKYTALDGVERNSNYNVNYLVNLLVGKEFENLGKKKNQVLGLNAKVFFSGGRKIIPLLKNEDGGAAVDVENDLYWDYERAYEEKIEDIYTVIISASYKWNKRGQHMNSY